MEKGHCAPTLRRLHSKNDRSFGVPISGLIDIPLLLFKQIFLQAKLIFLRYPKEIFLTFPIRNIICLGIAVAPFELTKAKKRQEE